MAKGSLTTQERTDFVRRICDVYPDARIDEQLDTPHNQVRLGQSDPLKRQVVGKRTLLFGELKRSVQRTNYQSRICPDYWHFSVFGHCPYGCKYCFLAGTEGVWFSPTVKIYVNLSEILSQIDRIANRLAEPTPFHLGKVQDGLALEPLTGFMGTLVPFFAAHKFARQIILTKSASVDSLLELEHRQKTILAWSLNPRETAEHYEANVPSVEDRIIAMQRCSEKGYPVRAMIMPIIPCEDWETIYIDFVSELLHRVKLQRLTLGGIYLNPRAVYLMKRRMGKNDPYHYRLASRRSRNSEVTQKGDEFHPAMYSRIATLARTIQRDLTIGSCHTL
ncbi:radical SAM protein [Candidatus Hydrogenedentota bacterium]